MAVLKTIQMTDADAALLEGIVRAVRNARGGGGVSVKLVPGQGLMITGRPAAGRTTGPGPAEDTPPILAKITGSDGAAHAWTEQRWTGPGTTEDLPDGRSGTTSEDPAYELNGAEGVADGTLVEIRAAKDTAGVTRYVFALASGGLPEGGQQYQVLQRDHEGAAVWDWVRLHP